MLSKEWMIVKNEIEWGVKGGICDLLYGVSAFVWRDCGKLLKFLVSNLVEGRAGRLQITSQASLIKTNCTVSLEVETCLSQRSSFFAVTNVKQIINDGQVKNSNETFVGCFKVKLVLFENLNQSAEGLVQSSLLLCSEKELLLGFECTYKSARRHIPNNLMDANQSTGWFSW
jgi:hypothetical protein